MQSYLDPDQNINDQKNSNQAPAPASGYLNGQMAAPPPQAAPQQTNTQPAINPTPTGTNTPGQVVTPGMASMAPPPPNPNTPGQQAAQQSVDQMNTDMMNKVNGVTQGPQGINPGYL